MQVWRIGDKIVCRTQFELWRRMEITREERGTSGYNRHVRSIYGRVAALKESDTSEYSETITVLPELSSAEHSEEKDDQDEKERRLKEARSCLGRKGISSMTVKITAGEQQLKVLPILGNLRCKIPSPLRRVWTSVEEQISREDQSHQRNEEEAGLPYEKRDPEQPWNMETREKTQVLVVDIEEECSKVVTSEQTTTSAIEVMEEVPDLNTKGRDQAPVSKINEDQQEVEPDHQDQYDGLREEDCGIDIYDENGDIKNCSPQSRLWFYREEKYNRRGKHRFRERGKKSARKHQMKRSRWTSRNEWRVHCAQQQEAEQLREVYGIEAFTVEVTATEKLLKRRQIMRDVMSGVIKPRSSPSPLRRCWNFGVTEY